MTITSSVTVTVVLTPPSPFLLQNVLTVLMDTDNVSAIFL
nr:MAG TPA: hypothetical protein [Caudoviricetes sp.]